MPQEFAIKISNNMLIVKEFVQSEPELWAIMQKFVWNTYNKDEAAEQCTALFHEYDLTHTKTGAPISKSAIRYAMREIN